MERNADRRRLLAGLGFAGAAALVHASRARPLEAATGIGPSTPTLRNVWDKVARTDVGLAETRTPVESLPGSATALHVISSPGVYYLTANLTGVAGKSAIDIQSDHVELECDSYTFLGVAGTLACIRAPQPQRCIAIYDAGFKAWQHTCIDLSNAAESLVEECWFDSCDATTDPLARGTCALGPGGVVFDCDVRSCHGSLVTVGANGIIEETTNMNGDGGCFASPGPAVMEDNFAINNSGVGFAVQTRGILIGNRLVSVGGIDVGPRSVVSENDIDGAPIAITVRGGRTNVDENYIANGDTGVSVLTGAGETLVDGNQIVGTVTAVVVDAGAPGCFVIRNCARGGGAGTSPYSIGAGSSYGPIVDVAGVGDVSAVPAAAHPWANFAY